MSLNLVFENCNGLISIGRGGYEYHRWEAVKELA